MGDGGPAGARRHCFLLADRRDAFVPASAIHIDERPALALTALLPLLGCGEEAATMAFDGLAERHSGNRGAACALHRIAEEERVHDALIRHLRDALPSAPDVPGLLDKARRFHIKLMRGGTAMHLARIAALDSAVCLILGRLLHFGGPLAATLAVASILGRIRADEARHVRLSRRLALDAGVTSAMRDQAAAARNAQADILSLVADPFEDLGVDFAALDRDLRRLPDGLLAG